MIVSDDISNNTPYSIQDYDHDNDGSQNDDNGSKDYNDISMIMTVMMITCY